VLPMVTTFPFRRMDGLGSGKIVFGLSEIVLMMSAITVFFAITSFFRNHEFFSSVML
jgi:hypothetical protein